MLAPEGLSRFGPAIRLFLASAALLSAACATDSVTRVEHAELLSSVRALRAENARLESRLEKLEAGRMLGGQSAAPRPTVLSASPQGSSDALPPLAVVKLKPKREAAPKLDTSVEVAEPVALYTDEPQRAAPLPDETDDAVAEGQFDAGANQLKTGNLEGGVDAMRRFVTDWPRHPRADNALYLAGVALHVQREFEQAAGFFAQVVAQYPAGDAVLDSMLKLADCRARLNRPREARATWEKIVANYPGTAAATQALARLSNSSSGSP